MIFGRPQIFRIHKSQDACIYTVMRIDSIDFEFELNDKMFLGVLCKLGHNYEQTGKSPRYKKSPGCCRVCHEMRRRKWLGNNSLRMKELQKKWNASHKKHHNEWKKKYRTKHPFKRYLAHAKHRAKELTALEHLVDEIYLEEQWIKQNGKCYWLKFAIDIDVPTQSLYKATLDRLVPSKGYVRGNVVWASRFANVGRSNVPAEEFEKFINRICK